MQDIRSYETVRYFVSAAGRIVPAPDNRLTASQCGFSGWQTVDAKGSKAIESLSIRLSQQLFEDKKALSAQQHLREKAYRDMKKAGYRLAIAQNYSQADVEMNQKLLKNMEERERFIERAILAQFDPTSRTSAFEMEQKEASPPIKQEGLT